MRLNKVIIYLAVSVNRSIVIIKPTELAKNSMSRLICSCQAALIHLSLAISKQQRI